MLEAKVSGMEWAVAEDGDTVADRQINAICVYVPVVNAISTTLLKGDL